MVENIIETLHMVSEFVINLCMFNDN